MPLRVDFDENILSFDARVVRRVQDTFIQCIPSSMEISGKLPAKDPKTFVRDEL